MSDGGRELHRASETSTGGLPLQTAGMYTSPSIDIMDESEQQYTSLGPSLTIPEGVYHRVRMFSSVMICVPIVILDPSALSLRSP